MELVEDLGAKVNKCSYINEYISFFLQCRSKDQVYSDEKFDLWPVYSGERFRAPGPSCFLFLILLLFYNAYLERRNKMLYY